MSVNSKMTAIAAAIRQKRGISDALSLDQMAAEIGNIHTGITPVGTKTITANGSYDVTEFASALVNVAGDFQHGEITLTSVTSTITIPVNGTLSHFVMYRDIVSTSEFTESSVAITFSLIGVYGSFRWSGSSLTYQDFTSIGSNQNISTTVEFTNGNVIVHSRSYAFDANVLYKWIAW